MLMEFFLYGFFSIDDLISRIPQLANLDGNWFSVVIVFTA